MTHRQTQKGKGHANARVPLHRTLSRASIDALLVAFSLRLRVSLSLLLLVIVDAVVIDRRPILVLLCLLRLLLLLLVHRVRPRSAVHHILPAPADQRIIAIAAGEVV